MLIGTINYWKYSRKEREEFRRENRENLKLLKFGTFIAGIALIGSFVKDYYNNHY